MVISASFAGVPSIFSHACCSQEYMVEVEKSEPFPPLCGAEDALIIRVPALSLALLFSSMIGWPE